MERVGGDKKQPRRTGLIKGLQQRGLVVFVQCAPPGVRGRTETGFATYKQGIMLVGLGGLWFFLLLLFCFIIFLILFCCYRFFVIYLIATRVPTSKKQNKPLINKNFQEICFNTKTDSQLILLSVSDVMLLTNVNRVTSFCHFSWTLSGIQKTTGLSPP